MFAPGFIGTGPRSYGAITGGGIGFYILKIPDIAKEPITGFAGVSGRPVAWVQSGSKTGLVCLRADVHRFQVMLDAFKRGIRMAEKNCIPDTRLSEKR